MFSFGTGSVHHVVLLFTIGPLLLLQFLTPGVAAENFNLTAIGAHDGKSAIECWQITRPFDISTQSGSIGAKIQQLGDVANLTLDVFPPKFFGGYHRAPNVQWVLFISGKVVVSLPNSTEKAVIPGGRFGLTIATDVAAVSVEGHITNYTSDEISTALQIPTKDGVIPPHTVLHTGGCRKEELSGL